MKTSLDILDLGLLLGSRHGLVLPALGSSLRFRLGLVRLHVGRRGRGWNIGLGDLRSVLIDILVQLVQSMRVKLVNVQLNFSTVLKDC
jgi:hypothetical protein